MKKKYNQKASFFIEKMNKGENKDILIVDLIDTLDDTEREANLLISTEVDRIKLLNENLELKKELGKLRAVRDLMKSAEIYGYQDLVKQFEEEKMREKKESKDD
jgi:small-conductance mechanosensitive channel